MRILMIGLFICSMPLVKAQQTTTNGSKPQKQKSEAITSLENELNEIDASLSSIMDKIHLTMSDTANFIELRGLLKKLDSNFNKVSTQIDQKLQELTSEPKVAEEPK